MDAANRVLFNTGVLYAKMLITMGISLYSTRLILNVLGASDYGIFSLIAGVVAMLSFLNSAMSASTQRYLSFHQRRGDFGIQKKIFTNNWVLHIAIPAIFEMLAILELWLKNVPCIHDCFLFVSFSGNDDQPTNYRIAVGYSSDGKNRFVKTI